MTGYIQREIHGLTRQALETMPVVVITGMRQTGKTTFLRHDSLFSGYRYLSLDDFATLETARARPSALLSSPGPVCIDEAQKAPELLTAVKKAVDDHRQPGMIVLTGSANFALLKGMSESLAGRAVYCTLQPFSRRELLGQQAKRPFIVEVLASENTLRMVDGQAISAGEVLLGGMPPVREFSPSQAAVWFRGFEQTYLERDIRDLARIDDLLGFRTVIKLASLRTGQIVNFSQIARDARLSSATTTRYLKLAEVSFLLRQVQPYLRNKSSRLIKSPKMFVNDSGLACYLTGVEVLDAAENEPLRGALVETYVAQNLASILEAHLPDARLHFWHVQGRYEVDFVIEWKNSCMAIEVKAAGRWSESDLVSLKAFQQATPRCRTAILAYNGAQPAQLGENLWALPLSALIS